MKIKSYSKKELRQAYGVSRETFNKWLRPIIGKLPHYNTRAKLLTPAQVEVIVQHLGIPDMSV